MELVGEMSTQPPHTDDAEEEEPLMDFDDDVFSSYPMSPLVLSSPEHPLSPLWVFPDVDDDCFFTGNATSTLEEDEPVFLIKTSLTSGNKRRLPPPSFGLCPQDYLDQSCSTINDKMIQALRHFKESTEQHVLVQVWVPVKNGDQCVLTTSGQPFVLDAHSNGLHKYRMASLMYMFSVDDDSDLDDLPARVFRQKLPEWTPDVHLYSSKEYQRLTHALNYNVRGSLALPVFEHSSISCVGVIELIMTSQKINYGPEVDKVCKALEAVNLKSTEILNHPNTQQICNKGRQNALAEILEILTLVCETLKIPLAQTWIPCRHRSVLAYGGGFKKSCSSFDGSCMGQVCMSTAEVAFYVLDAHMWGFREACAEHHLQKGQGVAGQAFASRNPCFCEDIRRFSKTEYSLVHYARMFGLTSSFAICVQSNHTGNDDYILEFFLPLHIRDCRDQQALLDSLSVTMKQHFQSLKVASHRVTSPSGNDDYSGNGDMNTLENLLSVTMREHSQSIKFASGKEIEEEVACIGMMKASTEENLAPESEIVRITENKIPSPALDRSPSRQDESYLNSQEPVSRVNIVNEGGSLEGAGRIAVSSSEHKDKGKRTTGEHGNKTIRLESPQKYFDGIPKDAAMSFCTGQSPCCKDLRSNEFIAGVEQVNESRPRKKRGTSATDAFPAPVRQNPADPEEGHNLGVLIPPTGIACTDLAAICALPISNPVVCAHPEPFNGGEPIGTSFLSSVKENAVPIHTIKVACGNYTIRFSLSSTAGIIELKNAVAKRLKLKLESFNMKYLDDDQELILIACDADLLECFRILKSLGNTAIRLLAEPIAK